MKNKFVKLLSLPYLLWSAGFIIIPVVSVFTRKPDSKHVDGCFASYKKKHQVEEVDYLSDK